MRLPLLRMEGARQEVLGYDFKLSNCLFLEKLEVAMMRLRLPFLLILIVGSLPSVQGQGRREIQVEVSQVSDGTYMLTGSGGNIGLSVGEDCAFIIDDQFAPLTEKIQKAVASVSNLPIKFVLNTHWHGDHTGGNENFGKAGVLIVAHENVRKRMSSEQFTAAFGRQTPPYPKEALPVVTFTDGVTFHLNGEEIQAFHVPPAHTDGDAVVHFRRQNVVHMGDLFFNGIYPFIDRSSGGSVDGMIAASERVLSMIDNQTKIIPGHGPLGGRAQLQSFRDMLEALRNRMQSMIRSGKSLAEIQQAKPTKDFDEHWGKGFMPPDRFVELIHDLLTH